MKPCADGQNDMRDVSPERRPSVVHLLVELQRLSDRQHEDDRQEDQRQCCGVSGVGVFEPLQIEIEQQRFRSESGPLVRTATVSNTLKAEIDVVTTTNIVVGPSIGQVTVREAVERMLGSIEPSRLVEIGRGWTSGPPETAPC